MYLKKKTWSNYFHKLWTQTDKLLGLQYSINNHLQPITMDEIITVIRRRNNNAPGEDNINLKVFKFSMTLFLERFLSLLNRIWEGQEPPCVGKEFSLYQFLRKEIVKTAIIILGSVY